MNPFPHNWNAEFERCLAVLGLHWCAGFSLVVASRSCSVAVVRRLLIVVVSLGSDHGLWGPQLSPSIIFPGREHLLPVCLNFTHFAILIQSTCSLETLFDIKKCILLAEDKMGSRKLFSTLDRHPLPLFVSVLLVEKNQKSNLDLHPTCSVDSSDDSFTSY
ncbi:hypothetical protein MJT46_015468 [Ovis ammon polii x Ovis aries]|nr:hypothetical protein MJT46_015468 [Ovis ammon polii x Ovis aries]